MEHGQEKGIFAQMLDFSPSTPGLLCSEASESVYVAT